MLFPPFSPPSPPKCCWCAVACPPVLAGMHHKHPLPSCPAPPRSYELPGDYGTFYLQVCCVLRCPALCCAVLCCPALCCAARCHGLPAACCAVPPCRCTHTVKVVLSPQTVKWCFAPQAPYLHASTPLLCTTSVFLQYRRGGGACVPRTYELPGNETRLSGAGVRPVSAAWLLSCEQRVCRFFSYSAAGCDCAGGSAGTRAACALPAVLWMHLLCNTPLPAH